VPLERSHNFRLWEKRTQTRTSISRPFLTGRVEMWRGCCRLNISVAASFVWPCLVVQPWLRFHIPLIGRVEDWRAGVGRSLCSLLSRPFVCECHTISTMPRFRPPPRRTQRADFLALRSPVCFASRFMGPILQERLSTSVAEPGSR
jgi:hypothetical protein